MAVAPRSLRSSLPLNVPRRSTYPFGWERRHDDVAVLVAKAYRIKQVLGWRPQYDGLETIVQHALAWERKLAARDFAPEAVVK